jgi:hypothetical protein
MKPSRWSGPPCPQDAEHDRLLDSPSATAAWYCPHVAHTGTPFYDSDLAPVSRTGPDGDSAPEARGHRGQPGRPDPARPGALLPSPDPAVLPRVGGQLILPAPVGWPGNRPSDVTGGGRPYPPRVGRCQPNHAIRSPRGTPGYSAGSGDPRGGPIGSLTSRHQPG